MSIAKRLIGAIVPAVQAGANCGRCERYLSNRCCRPYYRRYNLVDYCGNSCGYGCTYAPRYCG